MTDSDTYELTFASDMPVQDKALLIGAAILMDFMYYEHNGENGGWLYKLNTYVVWCTIGIREVKI